MAYDTMQNGTTYEYISQYKCRDENDMQINDNKIAERTNYNKTRRIELDVIPL